jgi:hypothetical protein
MERNDVTNIRNAASLLRGFSSRTRIFAPLLLAPLLAAAGATGSIQNVWAEEEVLLDEDSEEWEADSSGYESPDGVWEVVHPGHGEAEVDDGEMQLRPELDDNDRHSTLVTAREVDWEGIHGEMEVRLDEQSDDPENWDSFWAMLAYVDQTTHISLLIKTDDGGWMVSKRDHDHEGEDLHEVIAKGDEIPEAEEGHWYEVEWWIEPTDDEENLHIKVVVDGEELVDQEDDASWDRDGDEGEGTSGYFVEADKTFGAYSEKSYTSWRNISVESIG